jgi:antitoxin component HigA of HigAB toxin-antitoxin module
MNNEHFAYLDELKIQLPALKFIRAVKLALIKYFEQDENFDRYVENVRLLMHLENLTVETLSEKAGFNRSYVGRLLRKESSHRKVSVDSVRKMAETLNVKPSFLILAEIQKIFRKSLEGVE